MKIVIDIPEEVYEDIQKKSTEIQVKGYVLENAVLNGIPLPKGHDGREEIFNSAIEAELDVLRDNLDKINVELRLIKNLEVIKDILTESEE